MGTKTSGAVKSDDGNTSPKKEVEKKGKVSDKKDVTSTPKESKKGVRGRESSNTKPTSDATQSKKPSSETKSKEKKNYVVFRHLRHLLLTEKSIDNINMKNTLVFVVDMRSTKPLIKHEVEKAFNVKVEKVNTLIDRKGRKKAYVKLKPEYSAIDVATQLGMM